MNFSALHQEQPQVECVPQWALACYHVGGGRFGGGEAILLRHELRGGPDGAQFGPGVPLTVAGVERLLRVTAGQKRDGLLPERLLADTGSSVLWYSKPCVAPMYFKVNGKQTVLDAVPWPALLYLESEHGIFVWALKNGKRPTDETTLYHAPLMNIDARGRLCAPFEIEGRDQDLARRMAGVEDAVFKTNFSHINHSATINLRTKDGQVGNGRHLAFWRSLAKQKKTRFPVGSLVKTRQTVGDVL